MKVAIIGAGASGLMCACHLVGYDVTVFEKNATAGRKLLLTGNGRCNITNLSEPRDFLESVPHNSKFLSSCIYGFSPSDTIKFFENIGVPIIVESGRRAFPKSNRAETVKTAMEKFAKQNGVKFKFGVAASDINLKDYDAVIVATGGISFPVTGSTGDGYAIAKKFGHAVKTPRPALCGLNIEDSPETLQGVSVNCGVQIRDENLKPVVKKIIGDVMFTHYGVSGPAIFTTTSMFKSQSIRNHTLHLDFENSVIPKSLSKWLETNKPTFAIKGFDSIKTSTVTRGGIDVLEINPKTMESKLVPGLYFIGEVLDVDGLCGGFNLQIAFSTAVAAARSINQLKI